MKDFKTAKDRLNKGELQIDRITVALLITLGIVLMGAVASTVNFILVAFY